MAGSDNSDLTGINEHLVPGNLLPPWCEPDNAHDQLAIKIMDKAGRQLGCVPRAKNEALALLMDAGKLLLGRIDAVDLQNDWLRINTRIFMRDW